MRSIVFEVPVDLMVDFAQVIEQHELDNVIEGITVDDDIEIRVDYKASQRSVINKIHEMIDEFKENNSDEDDDEEDYQDDDEGGDGW